MKKQKDFDICIIKWNGNRKWLNMLTALIIGPLLVSLGEDVLGAAFLDKDKRKRPHTALKESPTFEHNRKPYFNRGVCV